MWTSLILHFISKIHPQANRRVSLKFTENFIFGPDLTVDNQTPFRYLKLNRLGSLDVSVCWAAFENCTQIKIFASSAQEKQLIIYGLSSALRAASPVLGLGRPGNRLQRQLPHVLRRHHYRLLRRTRHRVVRLERTRLRHGARPG